MSELEHELAIFNRPAGRRVGEDWMPELSIPERHRDLTVAALRHYAAHLEEEMVHRIAFAEEDGKTAVRSVRERTTREIANAEALAIDLESAP